METQKKGKFIVIEGLDGSGKTTQAKILCDNLNQEGINTVVQAEPTKHEFGKICREILSGKRVCEPTELALLFTLDRVQHNKDKNDGIMQYLDRGINVITDRYYYSTFCYQGVNVDMDWLENMNLNCPDILTPDLVIFLDLEPETSMERINQNRSDDEIEIFESLNSLTKIRNRFNEVLDSKLNGEKIVKISAVGSIDEIQKKIRDIIDLNLFK